MSVRREHKGEELRVKALDAAEKIVREQGLSGLSTRKVAAAMGYSVGTLYLVFDHVDALIMAVNVRTLEQLEEQLPSLDECDHPRQYVERMARSYIHYATHDSLRWLAVFEHHLPDGLALSLDYQTVAMRLFLTLEKPLASLNPTWNEEQVKVEARALWSAIHGLCSLTVADKLNRVRSVDPEKVVAVILNRFMEPYGVEPEGSR